MQPMLVLPCFDFSFVTRCCCCLPCLLTDNLVDVSLNEQSSRQLYRRWRRPIFSECTAHELHAARARVSVVSVQRCKDICVLKCDGGLRICADYVQPSLEQPGPRSSSPPTWHAEHESHFVEAQVSVQLIDLPSCTIPKPREQLRLLLIPLGCPASQGISWVHRVVFPSPLP